LPRSAANHDLERLERRGIVAAGLGQDAGASLPGNERGGGSQVGEMARPRTALAARELLFCERRQRFPRADRIHEAGLERGHGGQLFAAEDNLERLRQAD